MVQIQKWALRRDILHSSAMTVTLQLPNPFQQHQATSLYSQDHFYINPSTIPTKNDLPLGPRTLARPWPPKLVGLSLQRPSWTLNGFLWHAWRFRLVRLRVQVVRSQFSFKGVSLALFHKSPMKISGEAKSSSGHGKKRGPQKAAPDHQEDLPFPQHPNLHEEACTCHVSAAFWFLLDFY